jgi:ATP-dependent helicase YprA (DUF1998 family)
VKTVLLSYWSDMLQAMAFKPILEGRSCIVADQTGSGKTLAYLSPLVQMLRAEEGKSDTKKLNKKPRVLVLVPTSELAVQVSTFHCFASSILIWFEQVSVDLVFTKKDGFLLKICFGSYFFGW